ncbi:amidase [Paenirhodobacter populi]|uniref:amidase n=1 Tax=Paenirhodobacter populi TaxID=2306993 RepID=UPI000FE3566C|nr:amidase family protein [Sinirhodobacter populi]RWR08288.1 amidase [Sinirhodobacter populi]
MTDPADLSATEARALIGRRQLSPVELTRACLDRLHRLNPVVNAVVSMDEDAVLAEARAAETRQMSGEPLGAVEGLPFGVKDMINVSGLPTTFGSLIYRDNVAKSDDPIVAALRGQGGIVLGKTNNPEFSLGGNTRNAVYGATGNPHDPTKSAAGSSGGSAAALACGMAPLCTGSDTGGSLRNPAAFCGVVGYRPSPGVVPGNGRGIGLFHFSTSGPMARTVDDAALMLSVMARPDRADPLTPVVDDHTIWDPATLARPARTDAARWRVAVTEDFGFTLTEGIIRRAFAKRIDYLRPHLGRVEEAHPDCTGADRIFAVLRGVVMLGGHLDGLRKTPEAYGPNVHANVEEGLSFSVEDVTRALTDQTSYYRRWQRFFETTDFILSPAVTISPRDWHELYPEEIDGQRTESYYHWLSLAYASTLAGHPSITLPIGRDETGMPFGLQIIGRRNEDAALLSFAREIEAICAASPEMAFPKVDVAALAARPPIATLPGFRGFD